LLDQWKERISEFLGIPVKEIGTLSGSKKKLTGE
jgi:superfamily II DNA or RNA helicase